QWSTERAKTVNITGLGDVPPTGSRVVSPSSSTTYTGTARGDGGNATASTRITVETPTTNNVRNTPSNEPNLAKEFSDAVAIVYFDFDKADLKPEAQAKLRRAAQWLREDAHRTIDFRIEGNCDPRGTAEYNLGLGDRRARAAKEFLASLGVDASRIGTISYGIEKAQGRSEGSPDHVPSWAHDRHDDFVYTGKGHQ
ncbi:MAG TPA: OmpA family protein, partial [Blastocatellia bacterium]|nr:OmpA family protein [Blastocatellia bacterium]